MHYLHYLHPENITCIPGIRTGCTYSSCDIAFLPNAKQPGTTTPTPSLSAEPIIMLFVQGAQIPEAQLNAFK